MSRVRKHRSPGAKPDDAPSPPAAPSRKRPLLLALAAVLLAAWLAFLAYLAFGR